MNTESMFTKPLLKNQLLSYFLEIGLKDVLEEEL